MLNKADRTISPIQFEKLEYNCSDNICGGGEKQNKREEDKYASLPPLTEV